MEQTSPYTITRFTVLPVDTLVGIEWAVIATADLNIKDKIRVRDLSLEEHIASGVRRVTLPLASPEVTIAIPLRTIAECLSAAYDDEMAHLDTDDDEDTSDDGYYGSAAHEGDVPHPGIGSVSR